MNVLLVQTHPIVGPDMVENSLRRQDVPYELAASYAPEPLPDAGRFAVVIVFGSPASCSEIPGNPELRRLRDWVAGCVATDRAVLGICFGAQLLAHVLGAAIREGVAPEFGSYEVTLTEDGSRSPYFEGFPPTFPMIQWHRDRFELPKGATSLATSPGCPHQAFVRGRCIGLQFHVETSPQTMAAWVEAYPDGLAAVKKTKEHAFAECQRAEQQQARLCDLFVQNLLRVCG